jgi:NADH dehydrogenase FAD-containing subunit
MSKHLVLVGGGHAHMVTLVNLGEFIKKGHRVTVIGPSDFHYYSGMGPGMLSKIYTPDEIRFATRHVVEKQGGTFVRAKVDRIDPQERTAHLDSGESISYDAISFNAGSHVPRTLVGDDGGNVFTVKPIEKLLQVQQRLLEGFGREKITVAVVGGGAAAVEVAGNIWRLAVDAKTHMPRMCIFAGRRLMSRFPENIRRAAHDSLARRGMEIYENAHAAEVTSGRITLDSGDTHAADLVVLAHGVKPSPIFKASGLPTGPDGGLLVNTYLQSPVHPEVFGGGDCIYLQDQPLDKVGVYAVRQNPVLFHNLMASLDGTPLETFDPGGDYLLIFNMGDGTGILRKKWLLLKGRPAFWVKDYIDRKFMRKFQAVEG